MSKLVQVKDTLSLSLSLPLSLSLSLVYTHTMTRLTKGQIIYKVKNLCFLYEKLSYPQSLFIPHAGKPVSVSSKETWKGRQALLDGSCSP